MQVTLDIPDALAAQLAATGKEPARAALDALEEWAISRYDLGADAAEDAEVREAIRQGLEDVAAGRTVPLAEGFARFREKHGLAR